MATFRGLAIISCILSILGASCSDGTFLAKGNGGATGNPQNGVPPSGGDLGGNTLPDPNVQSSGLPNPAPQATPTPISDGGTIDSHTHKLSDTVPLYEGCAALPQAGRRAYPAKCPANQVLSVINDGSAREMTCCPLGGTVGLSQNPADQYIERTGRCAENEVGVGMIAASGSRIYCTKIDTRYFKLGPPETAIYAKNASGLSAAMRTIANSYHRNDCCICPVGKIIIGDHSPSDNVCRDQCVAIVPKS